MNVKTTIQLLIFFLIVIFIFFFIKNTFLKEQKDIVNLELKTKAREAWCTFTTDHPGERVAIVLDNIVYMDPFINEPICGGGILVTGFENQYESNEIAGILQAGQLAASMKDLQSTFIGPSLGKQSIENGSKAMGGGLLLVLIFMVIYYL